ncbi:MAG: DUF2807 domain-containing protein [Alphaproteobacteria bacterium]
MMRGTWRIAAAVIAVGVMMTARHTEAADPPMAERTTSFAARTLDVHDLMGRLTIEAAERADMQVVARGPKKAVDALLTKVRGDVLEVSGGGDPDSSVSVVQMNNITTVVTGGGSASVTIGGRDASVNVPPRPPLEVTVRVPRRTPVRIERASDTCTIGDTGGPLRLGLASASVTAGRVGSVDLAVDGSGDVHIRRVDGDMTVALRGSGDVTVDEANIGALSVAIDGNGDVSIGGKVRTATLAISGAGDIRIKEVASQPKIAISGAGNVSVGNW